jgi:hypothetical protein
MQGRLAQMTKFIRAGHGRYINLNEVVQFNINTNGEWCANLRDGESCTLHSTTNDESIDFATSTIIPATADDVLHRFYLREGDDRSFVHRKERVIAWAVGDCRPTPITANGPRPFGMNSHLGIITAIQHPDGRYDDLVNNEFDDEDAVRKELERMGNL